ncbi:MAG: hypothetical protein QE272_11510 [Nevskia sp.]|nr:hypothetical protein [Nevskia sp.]
MKTFVPVDDAALIQLIQAARQRIVFIAPGMMLPVAKAFGQRIEETDQLNITLVLDSDEEVFRVGYGEMAALEYLHRLANRQGFSLRSQPGLRVGVLLSDENMMVWSPTPRSVEAPPDSAPSLPADAHAGGEDLFGIEPSLQKRDASSLVAQLAAPAPVAPNGLMLGANPASQLAKAVSAEGTATLPQDGEIGRQAITPHEVQETAAALEKNPPIPVDLARVTRVFSTKLQFVEFKVTRAKLSKMKLTVASGLLNADAKDELEGLIDSKLSAFGEMREVEIEVPAFVNGVAAEANGKRLMIKVSEASLERDRNSIEKRFIYDIKDFGRLIEKDRKDEFQLLLDAYKTQLLAHATGVRAMLDEQAQRIVDDAVALIAARHESGRAIGKQVGQVDRDELRTKLLDGLERAKGEVPTVTLVFKDVTYEQTQSPVFRERVDKALPAPVRKRLGPWNAQFDAAKRRDDTLSK